MRMVLIMRLSDPQGRAVELEGRLRDKELEVEQLRKALAQAGVKQETVASPDDHVSSDFCCKAASCGCWNAAGVVLDPTVLCLMRIYLQKCASSAWLCARHPQETDSSAFISILCEGTQSLQSTFSTDLSALCPALCIGKRCRPSE